MCRAHSGKQVDVKVVHTFDAYVFTVKVEQASWEGNLSKY